MPRAKSNEVANPAQAVTVASSVELGQLAGFSGAGRPLVRIGNSEPVEALCTVDLDVDDIGREVTLVFVIGDRSRPIISGLLREPSEDRQVRVLVDGETVTLSANRELVLECGKSSIHLRRDGKIVIRGEQLVSRATGTHRIRGGSIQLN